MDIFEFVKKIETPILVFNKLGSLLYKNTGFDVLFIDVPDAATDVILGAGRYHDVQDKAG